MVRRTILFFVLAVVALLCTNAQLKFPAPVNTEYQELTAALLPDSSIIVVNSPGEQSYNARRYVYDSLDDSWRLEPSQLTDLFNSILYEGSHLHFRFSNDYSRVVVMLHGKGDQRIFYSKYDGKEWSLFRDIIDPGNYTYFNYAPTFSYDNKKLYLSDKSKPKNSFFVFNDTENFTKPQRIILDYFSDIDDVIAVGNNSLMVRGSIEKSDEFLWYYVEQTGNNEWTVPYHINELSKDNFYYALSFTPFSSHMIYGDWEMEEIMLQKTPALLEKELIEASKNRSKKPSANKPVSAGETSVEEGIKPGGNYYALLLGNSDYEDDKLDLSKPHEDVLTLEQVLKKHYTFDPENIYRLENATREEILKALFDLRSILTKDDNLLIFYAGHGHFDEDIEQGYWWPADARNDNPANWLSNSDLKEQISGLNTAHTLLISDACFSGGIFKTRGGDIRKAAVEIQLLYRMPSRRAMTSGTMSTVPDNSVFFKYLTKYLETNDAQFLPSSELFTKIRKSVLNNSLTVPQDGVIMGTGDEGGDFIFIRKDQ